MRRIARFMAARLLWPIVRWRGSAPLLYLTFDDGPCPILTPRVVAALEGAGVRATFFMTAEMMMAHPDLVRLVYRSGHVIASHGFRHTRAAEQSWKSQWHDLLRASTVFAEFGLRLRCYRPPYGELSVVRLLWCVLHGVRVYMWSYDSLDSYLGSSQELEMRFGSATFRGGDVVLLHDDTSITSDALPSLLRGLIARGHAFGVLA